MKLKAFLLFFLLSSFSLLQAADKPLIKIETERTSLIYQVADNGRLYQKYLGKKLNHDSDIQYLPQGTEAYLTHGMEDYFEPAIHIRHNDNNSSLLLKYVDHSSNAIGNGVNETVITLKDDKYPVTVKLHYVAYGKENIIRAFSEISHEEKKPVILCKYASSMLHLNSSKYFLTEFSGDWAHEANVTERELAFGKKVIDTKLGARANMFVSPFFQLALDNPSQENAGEVLVGTIGWTGNFRFTFEVDNKNELRIISGINPYDSEYSLPAKEVFRTPDFYFTYSTQGKGEASRNFHDWARNHQVKNGNDTRMTLLNNWESTYFDFDENKLIGLMDEATKLGVDMFLLDDGWFANKYPRSSDHQGLGDWEETADKLPNGVGRLVEEAQKKGIKFGIWIEPEMVNPKSELYEKHKDWVIHLPNRDEYYFRNQMVLDLSNPKVQDHVFGVVDNLMTKYPGIAFFKWDCNSPITNIYSVYLKDKQSHLYVDYVRGLYKVLDRIKAKYPNLPMMLCAGGGGRSDYEALKYFTEFWPSDNTDPIERLSLAAQRFQGKAHQLLHRQGAVQLSHGGAGLAGCKPQHGQGGNRLRGRSRRRNRASGKRSAFADGQIPHLVLHLQHDSLRQLGTDALRPGNSLVIPGGHSQSHLFRRQLRQHGGRGLGPHAGNCRQLPETVQFRLIGKAEQLQGIFPHRQHGVQQHLFPHSGQLPGRVHRDMTAEAHAAAFHDGHTGFRMNQFSSDTVKQGHSPFAWMIFLNVRTPAGA